MQESKGRCDPCCFIFIVEDVARKLDDGEAVRVGAAVELEVLTYFACLLEVAEQLRDERALILRLGSPSIWAGFLSIKAVVWQIFCRRFRRKPESVPPELTVLLLGRSAARTGKFRSKDCVSE